MAYTPGNPFGEEEEQIGGAGAPSVSAPSVGSTSSVGGTVAGSSPVAQQNTAGGTGFTNIDRVLAANKGASGAVKQRADQALAKDAGAFSTKLGDATTQMNAQPGVVDPAKLVQDVMASVSGVTDMGAAGSGTPQMGSGVQNTADLGKATTSVYQQPASGAQNETKGKTIQRGTPGSTADVQAKAIEAATNALNAQYTAPMEVGYDVGNTEEAKRAKALSDSKTAGKQIAADTGTLAGYTGLDAIDRAIYGSAQEQPTLQAAAQAADAQFGGQTAQSNAFAEQSKGKADALAKNRADIATAFGAEAGKLKTEAQTAADNANTGDNALFSTKGEKDTWTPGSGPAQADQFVNAAGLNAIGKVLGDQSLMDVKAGPAYVAGTLTKYVPPEPPPDLQVGSQRSSTTQQVANATRGLDPDQLAEYQAIRKANPGMTPADAAYEAKTTTDRRKNPNVANVSLTGDDTMHSADAKTNQQVYDDLVKKGQDLEAVPTGIQAAIMQMLTGLGGA